MRISVEPGPRSHVIAGTADIPGDVSRRLGKPAGVGESRRGPLFAGGLALILAVAAAAFSPEPAPARDFDCGDFATQSSAQDHFVSLGGPAQDPDRLDGDHDGIACESLPCPCSTASTAP